MKSLALSLLVAVSVSLGAATALADTRAATTPSSLASAAAASMQQAKIHAERAMQYRTAARVATENAKFATQIAENDAKQGFPYEAGVAREKALKYQREAQLDLALAAREDALAAQLRAQAHRQMAQYQEMIGAKAPATR
jgi:hypothetical protein